jgi:hypothetical protein
MTEDAEKEKKRRRHPLFGCMKGTLTIAPGVDLTEPACPEWADIAEESSIELGKLIEEGRRGRSRE